MSKDKIFRIRVWNQTDDRCIVYEKTLEEISTGLVVLNNDQYITLSIDEHIGICDKEGNKIYVGDILVGESTVKMEVIRTNIGFALKYKDESVGLFVTDELTREVAGMLKEEKVEIIGNIYDNF